jgi:Transposase
MNASTHPEYAACVGLDWADRQHDVCLPPAGGDPRAFRVLPHRPEPMAPWGQALRQRCAGRPIAVGRALRQGPRVGALQPYDCLVRLPVHPPTRAQSRDAFGLRHATDDPTDAARALELVMTPRDTRTALPPQRAAMRALQRLVAQRRTLVADKVRLTHRLTAALKPYCPQILAWVQDQDTVVFWAFLTRWPTLKPAQRARTARLRAFFPEHNGRSPHRIAERLQAIWQATPLTADTGVITPNRLLVEVLVQP